MELIMHFLRSILYSRRHRPAAYILLIVLACSAPRANAASAFLRGDPNNDGNTNLADTIFVLTYLFSDGQEPACPDAADANDDGSIDLSDAVNLLHFLFSDGTLPAPTGDCGTDPTSDTLPECVYDSALCGTPPDPVTPAAETLETLLFSYMDDPLGEIDTSLFASEFQIDGFSAREFLSLYYFADESFEIPHPDIEDKKGIEIAYYQQDGSLYFYDIYTGATLPFPDSDTRAITELTFSGGYWQNDALVTYYESYSYFFMEVTGDDSVEVFAPGPIWEYEVAIENPDSYEFVMEKLVIGGKTIYKGFPEPVISQHYVTARPGDELVVETQLAVNGEVLETSGPITCFYTAGLFLINSPADNDYTVTEETYVEEELADIDWNETPAFSDGLIIPAELPEGWYYISVYTANSSGGSQYAYDHLLIPLHIEAAE